MVYLGEYFCESILNVQRLEGRCLHEIGLLSLSKSLAILSGNSAKVTQIGLVAHKHDHNILISVIPKLFQPSLDILECDMPSDIIDEQCSNSSPIVGACDCTVSIGIEVKKKLETNTWTVHCWFPKKW